MSSAMKRFNPKDIRIDLVEDRPKRGAWHNGPNPCWVVAQHLPTGCSVRVYSGAYTQHKARNHAMSLLELAVELAEKELPQFPERLNDV